MRNRAATSSADLWLLEAAPSWIALAGLAIWAWSLTLRDARLMGNAPGTMGMQLTAFLGMWLAMMVAMMLPSVAPVAILWSRSIWRGEGRGAVARALRLVGFVGGYFVAWGGLGIAAFGATLAAEGAVARAPGAERWIGAGLFAAAGAYQLTRWKDACLRHCRSPLTSVSHYTSLRGPARDLRVGAHHGVYCAGCCGGLMALLVALGWMNVPAMVLLTAVVFLEKVWKHGVLLAKAIGLALLLLAALAPFEPALVAGLP